MSDKRWTVTIKRDGGNECTVSFTICDGNKAERGCPHDAALAAAIGAGIKAVTPSDEPWRIAVVVNLLDWLSSYDGSPEMEEIAQKAREVFDAL